MNRVSPDPASARLSSSARAEGLPRQQATPTLRSRVLRWLDYDGSRPALVLLPLIVIPLAALFFIRAALHPGEPHLQIVGHYAPFANAALQIGTGPEAAIRLTEPEIDQVEGWLLPGADDFTYDHAAPTSIVRTAGKGVPIDRAVELGRHGDNASLVVVNGATKTAIPLCFFAGCKLTLKTRSGDYALMLPEKEGQSIPIGGVGGSRPLWLSYCGGHPVWSSSDGCTATVPFDSYFAAGTGRLIDATPPTGAPHWLDGAHAVFGRAEDNAYVQIGNDPVERVATPLQLELSAGARPFVIWKRGSSGHVYVSRTAPPGVVVTAIVDKRPTTVGTVEHLPYGSVLVLGSTPFRVTFANGFVEMRAVERRDRFHFFPSLSAGRINFTNRIRLLRDAGTAPAQRLDLTGVAIHGAPPPVASTAQGVAAGASWALPLPRWMRAAGVSATAAPDIALATVTPGGDHVALQLQTTAPGAPTRAIRDGEEIAIGGHLIRYAQGGPQLEQIGPPVMFSAAALLMVIFLTMRISASVPPNPRDPTPTIVVACTTMAATVIASLLIGGVSLMSHMAAVDTLIGKTDYYHRQLFYSFIALAFAAAILMPVSASKNPLGTCRTFFPLSLRVLVACAGALVVWQVADTIVWVAANGRGALQVDTVRDALFAGLAVLCSAAAMYATFVAVGIRAAVIGVVGCTAAIALSYRGYLSWTMSLGLVVIVGLTFFLRYFAEEVPSGARAFRLKLHTAASFITAHYAEPLNGSVVLGGALLVLGVGLVPFLSSGRDSAGVKPAEFAIWFLSIGLASSLTAQFRPVVQEARRRRWPWIVFGAFALIVAVAAWTLRYILPAVLTWALPPLLAALAAFVLRSRAKSLSFGRWLGVMMFVTVLAVGVTAMYGGAGDFGPVLVLLPTVAIVVLIWSLAPDVEGERGWARLLAPAAVFATLAWLVMSGLLFIRSEWAAGLAGSHDSSIYRASKRLVTFSDPWFTKEGSWGVQAQWLADGFYGTREPMIANLQSDLAFVAALRTFGRRSATAVLLGGYFSLVALAIICAWVLIRRSADQQPPPASDGDKIAAIQRRLESREAALLLFFAAIYLSIEVLIHVGSGFNAVPQTGVTLPWISSGGSAAVAFAGLFAITFARAVAVVRGQP
jgi:cell division protein FtsW (lipid II flippase)